MNHTNSVFRNSCLKVPVDPISKMPRSSYERRENRVPEQSSIESSSSCSIAPAHVDASKLKDFYKSIPDYNDIHHLPAEEFYSTLKILREKKQVMLNLAIDHIDCNGDISRTSHIEKFTKNTTLPTATKKTKNTMKVRRKLSSEGKGTLSNSDTTKTSNESYGVSKPGTCLKRPERKPSLVTVKNENNDLKITSLKSSLEKVDRQKRNHSACSISWNDKVEPKTDIDKKFDDFFIGRKYSSPFDDDDFKTQSMPSSPLRTKRSRSPPRRRKSITIPKPFKMSERDEEARMVNELRGLQKSFSEDMLNQKCERTMKFRARPVPIESRIPLYDKILQDQAMRRAITKINSEAELRAQMKPFSFTKREEKAEDGICERAVHVLPKPKKKKRFKARPVPKNLFSNYFFNRMKEDEFFRSMNKRIRAEELLRSANYPGNMAARDRSRLSTPAAHSDLPIDPSPPVPSTTSSDRRCASPTKKRKDKKEDFITTSPQPFRFNTADRAAKKMEEMTKKIYQESKSTESVVCSNADGPRARAYSALELRASAAGRSNLAALLRAESVRRRFEEESARREVEHRRRADMKHRDRLLRSKPAWHLVKNNHEEDIAMRLQTRRDEERMRREEFLHEMELMYGRVQQQPMLFERYYAPRYPTPVTDIIQLSPRKAKKKNKKSYHYNSPNRSRKVSINDTAETYNGDVADYLNRIDIEDKLSDSETSLDRCKF